MKFTWLVASVICVVFGCASSDKRNAGLVADTTEPDSSYKDCERWFVTLPQRFNPEAAENIKAVYQFRISSRKNGVMVWTVTVENGSCKIELGEPVTPNAVIISNTEDWLLITSRRMSGVWAFMTGRLKVRGDKRLARHLEKLFFQTRAEKRVRMKRRT